jgi:hypothetical protein
MYRNSGNVEYEMPRHAIEASGNVTKGLKIYGDNTRKAFNRFSITNSCTKDIAHNKESATV